MHDYYINELEEEIRSINEQIKHIGDGATRELKRLEVLKGEKEKRLRDLIKTGDMDLGSVESRIDEHYANKKLDNNIDMKDTISEIKRLSEARQSVNTNMAKRYYDRRINRQNEKLERLKRKGTRIVGKQRFFSIPRRTFYSLGDRFRARALGHKNYLEDRVNDYDVIIESLGDGFVDSILDKYYNFRLKQYSLSLILYNKIIESAALSNIIYRGSRTMVITPEIEKALGIETGNVVKAIGEQKQEKEQKSNPNPEVETPENTNPSKGTELESDPDLTVTQEEYNRMQEEKRIAKESERKQRLEEILYDSENIATPEEISKQPFL